MFVRIYDGMYVRTVGITHTGMYVFTMVCMYVCRYNSRMYVRIYDGTYVRTVVTMHTYMYVFTMVCMYVQ